MNIRFAPSLSGNIHVGNLASAFYNKWFSIVKNKRLIWRVDGDIGIKENFYIFRNQFITISVFKIKFFKIIIPQSNKAFYLEYLKKLNPYLYDESKLENGINYQCQRLNLKKLFQENSNYKWTDKLVGKVKFDYTTIKDPVVIKSDGNLTYPLLSVLCDVKYGITSVIRGIDLLNTAAIHHVIAKNIFKHKISFYHHGLLLEKGSKISKKKYNELTDPNFFLRSGFLPSQIEKWFMLHSLSCPIKKVKEFKSKYLTTTNKSYDGLNLSKWLRKDFKNITINQLSKYTNQSKYLIYNYWRNIRFNCENIYDYIKLTHSIKKYKKEVNIEQKELQNFKLTFRKILSGQESSPSIEFYIRNLNKKSLIEIMKKWSII